MEYLFSSARQVTGDAVAHMLTVKALLKWLILQVRKLYDYYIPLVIY